MIICDGAQGRKGYKVKSMHQFWDRDQGSGQKSRKKLIEVFGQNRCAASRIMVGWGMIINQSRISFEASRMLIGSSNRSDVRLGARESRIGARGSGTTFGSLGQQLLRFSTFFCVCTLHAPTGNASIPVALHKPLTRRSALPEGRVAGRVTRCRSRQPRPRPRGPRP